MLITIMNGSHRKNGNTARSLEIICRLLKENAKKKEEKLRINTIFLSEKNIQKCRGCRLCFDRGEEACPLKDDLLNLHREILRSDALVIASPVYVNDVSGTMKNFIDRLAFVCHRPAYSKNLFFLLATTGGSPSRHTIRTMQSAVISWGGQLIGSMGLLTGALSSREEIKKRYERRLEKATKKIIDYVINERFKNPSFISHLVFFIQQHSWKKIFDEVGYDSVDAQYWMENDLFEHDRSYFITNNSSAPKVVMARFIGSFIARLFN